MALQILSKDTKKDLPSTYKSIDLERHLKNLEEKLTDLRGCL